MKYIFLICIFLLLFFVLIISYKRLNENFDNNTSNKKCGNNFFESNSFCQLNVNTNKCECKFQKDDIKTAFNSPQICCKEMCNLYTRRLTSE